MHAEVSRFNFAFFGGTTGSMVGEKIAHAFEEATQRRATDKGKIPADPGTKRAERELTIRFRDSAQPAGCAKGHPE